MPMQCNMATGGCQLQSPFTKGARPTNSPQDTLNCRVDGRVQGVGFRYYVCEIARSLRLNGYVRNNYDGSVEVYAEGPRSQLEQLLVAVQRGPRGSHVSTCCPTWGQTASDIDPTKPVPPEFRIRY